MRRKIIYMLFLIGIFGGVLFPQATFFAETGSENNTSRSLMVELNTLKSEMKQLQEKIAENEQQIIENENQIEILKGQIVTKENELLGRMAVQQKQKKQNMSEITLMLTDSLTDFIKNWNAYIIYNKAEEGLVNDLLKNKNTIQELKQENEQKAVELMKAKDEIQTKIDEREQKLNRIKTIFQQSEERVGISEVMQQDIDRQLEILTGKGSGVVLKTDKAVRIENNWALPVMNGFVSTIFNSQVYLEQFERDHPGIDVAAGEGEPLYAIAAGRVVISGTDEVFGQYIVISHKIGDTPYISLYSHLASRIAQVGDDVEVGANIGTIGNTGLSFGAHLHLEVNKGRAYFTYDKNVRRSDAIDPLMMLPYTQTWTINEYV